VPSDQEFEGWHWVTDDVVSRDDDGARVSRLHSEQWMVTNRIGQLALDLNGKPAVFATAGDACRAVDGGSFAAGEQRVWLKAYVR
jgi:hypothetical protein